MDKTLTKRIVLNKYNIAKKELEIASLYLSDAFNYVPVYLHQDLGTAQEILIELTHVMQDFINNTENSGQPEKK